MGTGEDVTGEAKWARERSFELLGPQKYQVLTLSFLFQRPIASHPLVQAFIQGFSYMVPPIRSPLPLWDLKLVLSVL